MAVAWYLSHISPLSSKCENQIVSFYGFPLKSGTLDPPSAVILLHAVVYFWKPPTLLSLFKMPTQVCLLFTLPVRTNSKLRWLSICMRSWAPQEKPQWIFWKEACQSTVVGTVETTDLDKNKLPCLGNIKHWHCLYIWALSEVIKCEKWTPLCDVMLNDMEWRYSTWELPIIYFRNIKWWYR